MPKRLAASTRNFADAIFDFLPDATIVIDRDGKVVAWNKAMEALTGVPDFHHSRIMEQFHIPYTPHS